MDTYMELSTIELSQAYFWADIYRCALSLDQLHITFFMLGGES